MKSNAKTNEVRAMIAVLPGDGIGPEVTEQAVRVLEAVQRQSEGRHDFSLQRGLIGGAAIDALGDPLPADTLALCQKANAVLLGAVGGPKWDDPNASVRPEQGLLGLRKALNVYANLRPVSSPPALRHASPLRAELLADVDILFVRELTGGAYFGEKTRTTLPGRGGGERASDLCVYTTAEIERVVRVAATLARQRRRKLTSVDKANVMETSRLWRHVTVRVMGDEFPDVQLDHMLVDTCAMQLLRSPARFDVIVTENMFGDILTDEASMLAGSMGMLPSASLSECVGGSRLGLYEPIHGSAPDIAGRGIANPIGAILSVAMLLRHSLGLESEAGLVERAVASVIARGLATPDIETVGSRRCTTEQMGAAIVEQILASD
jgi:3-isopropylmalate dehydrogenase